MKPLSEKLKGRRRLNRPQTTISIRIPEDLIPDLEEMAPLLGYTNYQALIQSYIGQGMRRDEAKLAQPEVTVARETLERHGISQQVITEILAETMQHTA